MHTIQSNAHSTFIQIALLVFFFKLKLFHQSTAEKCFDILGYFENGHCKICLTQEQLFQDKSHDSM